MHMTPTVALLDYVEKNPNFKVEVLDSRTAKFFDVSDMTRGNAQLKILKQKIGGKPNLFNIPETELVEVAEKATGGPTPLGERYMDSLILRVTPNNPGPNAIDDVQGFIKNLPQDYFTAPEFRKIADTPEDIARSVDKNKLAQAEDVLKNTDVGKHISGTALDFAKKAGKVGFGTGMTAVAPGDVIIEQGIKRLLPKLGLAFISAPALAAYTAYEMALLAADVGKGLLEAKNRGDEESFKSAFWDGFTEDAYSDKYSIGYALTKEIHETLFQDVYGRIAQEYLPGSED